MTLPDWKSLSAPDRMAIILPLWDEGKSASDIAWYFTGASRDSVIGAIHRAKLPKRPQERTPKSGIKFPPIKKPKPEKPKKPSAVTASAFASYPDPTEPSESVMAMINGNRPPLSGTTPISILDLPNRPGVLCRFPVDMDGRMGYCGQPSGEKTHCKAHHAIMYRETDHKFRMPREARL